MNNRQIQYILNIVERIDDIQYILEINNINDDNLWEQFDSFLLIITQLFPEFEGSPLEFIPSNIMMASERLEPYIEQLTITIKKINSAYTSLYHSIQSEQVAEYF
jgi:hypothetical protein